MNICVKPAKMLRGVVAPPGDKSMSHRALMFNAVGVGDSLIDNCSDGDDVLTTLNVLRLLGVTISAGESPNSYIVKGAGMYRLTTPREILDMGNSGTTMRLLSGILAGRDMHLTLSGDASLRSRPMKRIIEPLRKMGANVNGVDDQFAPLVFNGGSLKAHNFKLKIASAQVKSCLLLAGLRAEGITSVTEPALTRDHTEKMLQAMGANINTRDLTTTIEPSNLQAIDFRVPGDISSALFWVAAALIHPDAELNIVNVGINHTRTAALDILRGMGASIKLENVRTIGMERVADLNVKSSRLKSTVIDRAVVPNLIDEIPILALVAAFAEGTTVIRDAAELRHKESDRIRSSHTWMKICGLKCSEQPDGMVIKGTGELGGGLCNSFHDHRIAMTLGIAGLVGNAPITIENSDAAKVSYPNFWLDLERISTHAG